MEFEADGIHNEEQTQMEWNLWNLRLKEYQIEENGLEEHIEHYLMNYETRRPHLWKMWLL